MFKVTRSMAAIEGILPLIYEEYMALVEGRLLCNLNSLRKVCYARILRVASHGGHRVGCILTTWHERTMSK